MKKRNVLALALALVMSVGMSCNMERQRTEGK